MISTKKLVTIGAAAAIFAATAVPALASNNHSSSGQFNFAKIWNGISASSNTGGNVVNGEVERGSTNTGDAGTGVVVSNVVNKNVSVGFGGSNGD